MTTFRTYTGVIAALFVLVAGLFVTLAPTTAHAQTPTDPETAEFLLEKKISDNLPQDPYAPEDFSFDIEGYGVVNLTPGPGAGVATAIVELDLGEYEVNEIGPAGFVEDDWTVQWSGYGCVSGNGPIRPTTITVQADPGDLGPNSAGNVCRADNQYRPQGSGDNGSGTTTDPELGGVEGTKYDAATDEEVEGWTIHLYDDEDDLVVSTTTDSSGIYTFTGIEPGDYLVCEEVPDMWKQVLPSDGTICPNGTYGHDVTVSEDSVTDAHDFWNIHDPAIIIDKVTTPNSSDTDFEFSLSWSSSTVMLADGDTPWHSGDLSDNILDGDAPFSIEEINIPTGWTLASVSCVSNLGNQYDEDAIDLQPGEVVTCTFTNDFDDSNGGGGQCTDESLGWADGVVDSNQAKKNDGSDITIPDRLDPSEALGAADWVGGGDTGFFSLGFGGFITVVFDKFVPDVDGDDISIHEATNDDDYPEETATVEVSQDGSSWFTVGTSSSLDNISTRVSYFDFASTGLAWIKYVRVTDTTDGSLHVDEADGFDLDAVDATEELCVEPEDGDDTPTYSQGSYGGDGYSQGSYGGGGDRVELREGGGGSSSGDDDDENGDGPEPEVLGEQVSAVPLGAANTGAGGAAPTALPMASALFFALAALGVLRMTREHA